MISTQILVGIHNADVVGEVAAAAILTFASPVIRLRLTLELVVSLMVVTEEVGTLSVEGWISSETSCSSEDMDGVSVTVGEGWPSMPLLGVSEMEWRGEGVDSVSIAAGDS